MKTLWTLLALLCAGLSLVQAAETNVLSYYAVENSLDGQLLIERTNVLHFYPVYAMREYADTVEVTIYYGSKRYSRFADKMDNGDYWEVRLPQFTLGESIQRMEVEVKFALDSAAYWRFASFRRRVLADLEPNPLARAAINSQLSLNPLQRAVHHDSVRCQLEQLLGNSNITKSLDSMLDQQDNKRNDSLDMLRSLLDWNCDKKDSSRTNILRNLLDQESNKRDILLTQDLERWKTDKLKTTFANLQIYQDLLGDVERLSALCDTFQIPQDDAVRSRFASILDSLARGEVDSRSVKQTLDALVNSLFQKIDSLKRVESADSLNKALSKFTIKESRQNGEATKGRMMISLGIDSGTLDIARREYVHLDTLARQMFRDVLWVEPPDDLARATQILFDALVEDYRWSRQPSPIMQEFIRSLQDSFSTNRLETIDSVRARLARDLQTDLSDTNYSGPSVRKCDIVIDNSSFARARILYRNYKTGLRKMPALDPVERMGIFRVRYVPFPIIGDVSSGKMRLHSTLVGDSSALVFEVGLGFGDIYIASDDLVPKELSIRRFGVAFAVTPRLFSKDADVLAVALTYDFNSYGSLGFGANLAHETIRPYASFGINKRAFEAAVTGLVKLFSQ